MGKLFLLLTILSESVAVISMKLSNGFKEPAWAVLAVITYALSFLFLTLALKELPAGIANGIWAAASTILVAIAGMLFLKERLNTVQIISLLLIAAGLVGLSINTTTSR